MKLKKGTDGSVHLNINMKKIVLSAILIFVLNSNIQSPLIPVDRRITWSPGITGGFPEINQPIADIQNFGADRTGQKDSYQAIIKALKSLPETGGVVFIPYGTYRIDSTIRITRSNIVIRGERSQIPKLLSYAKGNSIEIRPVVNSGKWLTLLSGYQKNASAVIVENASDLKSARFIEIQQENDSLLMYTNPEWKQGWSENSVGQLLEIDNISGNTIALKSTLNINFFPRLKPLIRSVNMIINSGLEDLYIEKKEASGHTIYLEHAAYCRIKGIESYHTRRSHVSVSACLGNDIRENYFHHSFSYGGGGSGYGVECNLHSTGTLVENNIFDSLRHAMMVQTGANGNVFAYNYSAHPVQGDGEVNLNQGWIPPDISIHGHYTFMNLFEGNHVSEIGIADYWGPAGPGNTFFRNKVIDEGIFYYDKTLRQNVIGNMTTTITCKDERSRDNIELANIVDNKLINPVENLPNSLYKNKKPDFFGTVVWPVYGPDVKGDNKLPAQVRYEMIMKKNF